MMKAESNIRLGMGVPHLTPIHDLEGYMQEVGRGGRATNGAVAVLYNNLDISPEHQKPS